MKIGICDDEKYIVDTLMGYCTEYGMKYNLNFIYTTFSNAEDMLEYMENFADIDVLLLDIQMKEINGIQAAYKIRERNKNIKIIFITSMGKYALEGYKVGAERYLIKPVYYKKFEEEMRDILTTDAIDNDRYILEKNDEGIYKIALSDVIFIETYCRNTRIMTIDGPIISYKSMKDHIKRLDGSFFQCHRSTVVNLNYVKNTEDNDIYLKNGEALPLSKYKKKEFKERLLFYYADKISKA